jgi:hypothetical protein
MNAEPGNIDDLRLDCPVIYPAGQIIVPKPFQFTLRQLLGLTGLVCLLSGAYYWLGESLILLVLVLAWLSIGPLLIYFTIKPRHLRVPVAVGFGLAFIALFMLPLFSRAHICTREGACRSNLRMIAIALHNYHDTYGSFPPAYIADANGKPMHSWRVLLLPFLEEKNLYDLYDFNEPWDGPHNSALALQVPRLKVFECPSVTKLNETNYVAVVGPQTMWPGEKTITFGDIKDGTSNTIMVVELHNSGIHWMEPRDLDISQMPMGINPPLGQAISSHHPHGAQVALADGSVGFLRDKLPASTLRALLTRSGGETIPDY